MAEAGASRRPLLPGSASGMHMMHPARTDRPPFDCLRTIEPGRSPAIATNIRPEGMGGLRRVPAAGPRDGGAYQFTNCEG